MPPPNAGQPAGKVWTWLRDRSRLMPGLQVRLPPSLRTRFEHAWAPMEILIQQLELLPAGLWDYLSDLEGGFVAIWANESRYVPGPATIGGQQVRNVAYVSGEDLARDNERPLHVMGHLIDHYLGCQGDARGPWLSEGGGASPAWQEAGKRLARLFALGYGVDEVALASSRDYLARSLATYCRDRQRLNVADPQIYKWLRSTLWNEAFWRAQQRE